MKAVLSILFILAGLMLQAQVTIPKLDWMHTISGSSHGLGYDVALDKSGNVLITGYFNNTVDFEPGPGVTNLTATGGYDVFVSKYTNDGTFIWAKSMGGSAYDYGYGIATDDSNNVLITGIFRGDGDFDPGPGVSTLICNNSGYGNAFIVKLDSLGNHVWSEALTSTNASVGSNIAADNNGNVYVMGNFSVFLDLDPGPGSVTIPSQGSDDGYMIQFDPAGNYLDHYTIGGSNYDEITEIDIDDQNNLYIAGRFKGTVDFDPGPGVFNMFGAANNNNAFIAKLDPNLNLDWARSIESSSSCYSGGVAVNEFGHVYYTGWIQGLSDLDPGPGVNMVGINGYSDVFIIRMDTAGSYNWALSFGGPNWDQVRGIDTDAQGNCYAVGSFVGTVDFDPGPGTEIYSSLGSSNGYHDLWVEKFDSLGNMGWVYTAGSTGQNTVSDIVVDDSARIYMGGYNEGTIDWAPGAQEVLINSPGVDAYAHVLYQCEPGLSVDSLEACDFAIWNGNLYTQSDSTSTYTILGGAANGCDSIISLYLKMNYTTFATDVQSACSSYTWIDGNTYYASTNSPQWVLTNAAGCDSVITLDLTIENNTGTDIVYACGSHTWIDGNTYTASTSSPTWVLTNAAGCDSLVTLNLYIGGPSSSTHTVNACGSYTWINGVTYTSSTNTPTWVIPNVYGCDSTITLDLTINNPSTGVHTVTACGSYTWMNGVSYTSSTNTPTYTLTNSVGCDSVVTLNLTILNLNYGTDVQYACDSYTWMNGATYTSSTNGPTWTLTGANGCDSIVTLDLTVYYSNTATDVHTTCDTLYWIDGNYYAADTVGPMWTLSTINGCDSLVTLDLTIGGLDSTATQLDAITLQANASGVEYQWMDCDSNYMIPGANNQIFVAPYNGSFAVQVTDQNCVDTSACFTVSELGLIQVPSPSRTLLKITDFMGRETKFVYGVPLLFIYDDGTIERVMMMEP